MTLDLTRRNFGLLTLGAMAVNLPGVTFAQGAAYANPGLLEEPGSLIGAVSPVTGSGQSAQLEGMVLVDVRPRAEYDAGHIPGAVYLAPDAVAARQSPIDGTLMHVTNLEALIGSIGIAADRRIVFYDDRGGFHAARMLWLMEYLGHQNVAVLNGGWSAWKGVGGPVATQAAAAQPTEFHSAISPRRHATANDVLAHRNDPDEVLIDVRPPHMYEEGHIPWAVNVPWAQNLGDDGRFRSAGELLAHFGDHGVTPENNVIMHCQNGLASSHSYVALRLLGFSRVRVYHRSWAEWGSDPALPKVTA
ncbi:sulfurtransferase [Ruegeria sp. R13_0]|uniref:sulfurtransferase n=1 Tax=Ruegeria sp. R13_0 TaxID=2821099 RepID=UPI001ADAFD4C|nr:sulfurtransferase [Ruegeria sp. R13_0]MBO9437002.1 sulfurtransferase [Ruegeria sp. R13_0]